MVFAFALYLSVSSLNETHRSLCTNYVTDKDFFFKMLKYFQLYDDADFRERQCELGKQSARADRECSVNRDLGGEAHKVSYF